MRTSLEWDTDRIGAISHGNIEELNSYSGPQSQSFAIIIRDIAREVIRRGQYTILDWPIAIDCTTIRNPHKSVPHQDGEDIRETHHNLI